MRNSPSSCVIGSFTVYLWTVLGSTLLLEEHRTSGPADTPGSNIGSRCFTCPCDSFRVCLVLGLGALWLPSGEHCSSVVVIYSVTIVHASQTATEATQATTSTCRLLPRVYTRISGRHQQQTQIPQSSYGRSLQAPRANQCTVDCSPAYAAKQQRGSKKATQATTSTCTLLPRVYTRISRRHQ